MSVLKEKMQKSSNDDSNVLEEKQEDCKNKRK